MCFYYSMTKYPLNMINLWFGNYFRILHFRTTDFNSCMNVELDHKESWALKNWCFGTVVLEKILESPLDCKEIKPDNPRRTDAEADAPILWPPDTKNWLIGNDPVARRLKAEGKGDDRRWDGWMASPTRWTWVWANSGSWWWTGRSGVLQSMGLQRVRHD